VVGGEVFGERQQVIDQRFHRLGPQHRRTHSDVAHQGLPDRGGHRYLGEALLQAACRAPPRGLGVDHAGLIEQLAQAGQPGPGTRRDERGIELADSAASNSSITWAVRSATSPPCQASTTARHSPSTVSIQELVQLQPVSASRTAANPAGSPRLDRAGEPGQPLDAASSTSSRILRPVPIA
jgi:hypothetical protein